LTQPQHDNQRRHVPPQELTRGDLADIARLLAEITSLHDKLAAARLRANGIALRSDVIALRFCGA
jgi:hypothetical protein